MVPTGPILLSVRSWSSPVSLDTSSLSLPESLPAIQAGSIVRPWWVDYPPSFMDGQDVWRTILSLPLSGRLHHDYRRAA